MEGSELHVSALDVVDPELALQPGIDPADLRVVVDRWVQIQVHASAHPEATEFGLLDAEERAVLMQLPTNGGVQRLYQQPLVEGSSPVLAAGDRATTLVLYRAGEELERIPVVLEAGRVNRIEP
jgi:hypothetical protein